MPTCRAGVGCGREDEKPLLEFLQLITKICEFLNRKIAQQHFSSSKFMADETSKIAAINSRKKIIKQLKCQSKSLRFSAEN